MKSASIKLLEDNFDSLKEYLADILPDGSGIDCVWKFDYQKNGKVIAQNSYHCMNEPGYYCGYADFTIKFNLVEDLRSFTLEFNGSYSQALNRKHLLRDYLEDTIYNSLPENRSIYLCLIKE